MKTILLVVAAVMYFATPAAAADLDSLMMQVFNGPGPSAANMNLGGNTTPHRHKVPSPTAAPPVKYLMLISSAEAVVAGAPAKSEPVAKAADEPSITPPADEVADEPLVRDDTPTLEQLWWMDPYHFSPENDSSGFAADFPKVYNGMTYEEYVAQSESHQTHEDEPAPYEYPADDAEAPPDPAE